MYRTCTLQTQIILISTFFWGVYNCMYKVILNHPLDDIFEWVSEWESEEVNINTFTQFHLTLKLQFRLAWKTFISLLMVVGRIISPAFTAVVSGSCIPNLGNYLSENTDPWYKRDPLNSILNSISQIFNGRENLCSGNIVTEKLLLQFRIFLSHFRYQNDEKISSRSISVILNT